MGALSKKLRSADGGRMIFRCPGCDENHSVNVADGRPHWEWNGDVDAPTFTPSILIRSGHFVPGHENGPCWCTYAKEHPEEADDGFKCSVCHCYVTDGRIQFLGDSTHHLSGQTVDIPDIEVEGHAKE